MTSRSATVPRRVPLWSIAVVYPLLLWWGRGHWFAYDEWEIITSRTRPDWGNVAGWGRLLFEPHNEHWATVPIVLFRSIFSVVGLRSYVPYLAVHLALHLTLVMLVGRRLRHCGVRDAVLLPCLAGLALYGAGEENVYWAFQSGWLIGLGLGFVLFELLVDADTATPWPDRSRRAGWVLAIVALMCTGLGLVVVATVAGAIAVSRGWRDAVRFAAVPAGGFGLWWITYGRGAGASPLAFSSWHQIVTFVAKSVINTGDFTTGLLGAGAVVAAVVALGVAWGATPASKALALGALGFLVLVAIGRVDGGLATAPRYAYVTAILVVPGTAEAIERLFSRRIAGRWLAAGLGMSSVAFGIGRLHEVARNEAVLKSALRGEVLAAFAIAPDALRLDVPVSPYAPTLDLAAVRALIGRGERPRGTAPAAAVTKLRALVAVSVTEVALFASDPADGTNRARIAATARAHRDPADPAVLVPEGSPPQIVLEVTVPSSVSLDHDGGGTVAVFAVGGPTTSEPTTLELSAASTAWLNFAVPGTYIVSIPDAGTTRVGGTA